MAGRTSRRRASSGGTGKYKWNKKRTLYFVLILVAIGVLVVVLLNIFGVIGKNTISKEALEAGELPEPAPSNVVEELGDKGQADPDPSSFHFEINEMPVFANGGAKGTLGIENPSDNFYAMHVEIFDALSDERLYSSGTLQPGDAIPEDSLLKWLKKGEHFAMAHIYAYHPETDEQVLQTSAGLTITVES